MNACTDRMRPIKVIALVDAVIGEVLAMVNSLSYNLNGMWHEELTCTAISRLAVETDGGDDCSQ